MRMMRMNEHINIKTIMSGQARNDDSTRGNKPQARTNPSYTFTALTSPGDEQGPGGHHGVSLGVNGADFTAVLPTLPFLQVWHQDPQPRPARVPRVKEARREIPVR